MKKEAILWTKLLILSYLQLFAFIAIAILGSFVSASFATYGWDYVIYDPSVVGYMPMTDEAIRAALCWVVAVATFIVGYSIYITIKLYPTNKKLIYTFGIFNWALIPYLQFKQYKNRYTQAFGQYLKLERNEGLQLSHLHFWECIRGKARLDKLFWNTCLGYLTFISSLVGFLSILSSSSYANVTGQMNSNFFFHIFGAFTSFSNEVLFVFMLAFICLHKRHLFRENTALIYITSYMLVVFLVYWCYLIPAAGFATAPVDIFISVWLHAINPILIIAFCINSFFQNYIMPKKKLYSFCLMGCILPMTYGLFIYLMPFLIHFSVYGALTNINFLMLSADGQNIGGFFGIIGFVALFLVFNLVFLLFRTINYFIVKKHHGIPTSKKVAVKV